MSALPRRAADDYDRLGCAESFGIEIGTPPPTGGHVRRIARTSPLEPE
jgi:hypothetical protein